MKAFNRIATALLALVVLFAVKTGSARATTVSLVAPAYATCPVTVSTVNEGNLTSNSACVVTITQCTQATGATPTPVSSCDFGNKDLRSLIAAGWTVLPLSLLPAAPVTVGNLPACSTTSGYDGAFMSVSNNVIPCPVPTASQGGPTPKATASAGGECTVHCNGPAATWVVIGQ